MNWKVKVQWKKTKKQKSINIFVWVLQGVLTVGIIMCDEVDYNQTSLYNSEDREKWGSKDREMRWQFNLFELQACRIKEQKSVCINYG